MGFMDKVKAAAGVGTATLQVDVKQKPSKRGEDLIAVIHVVGGKQTQKLNYVVADVRWIGKWSVQSADGRPINIDGTAIFYRQNQPNSEGIMLEAGKTLEFPVTVKIPGDGPLTGADLKYDFGVRADIEGSPDPHFNTQFEITG